MRTRGSFGAPSPRPGPRRRVGEPLSDWYRTFFDRAANDFWNAAVSVEQTAREVAFLVEALGVGEGDRVLDVPAGRGRLAIPLAERGPRVVAVDYSEDGVQSLQRVAPPAVAVVRVDMRALPVTGGFDAAYCMGNSFGYFGVDGVEAFLAEVARVVRPGGRFVLESASVREALVPSLAATTDHDVGGVRVHGRHRIEGDWLVSTLDTEHDGTSTRRTIRQLSLPYEHIVALVERARFTVTAGLGDVDGTAFTASAPSLLLVAERVA